MDKKKEALSHSMEDYMEMIYRNAIENGYIRINALAEALNVKAPSASKMVQKLGRQGLLRYEKYGLVTLTQEGRSVGKFLLDRHYTIEKFLSTIGVKENLLMNVELIEHNVTNNALEKIETLNRFFVDKPEILRQFDDFRTSLDNRNRNAD
jgi:Mn-dependent DtxR family transcriptional regulator